MKKAILLFVVGAVIFITHCASYISECDEAIEMHQKARGAIGKEREDLEMKAAAYDALCAQKRSENWEEQKKRHEVESRHR